MTSAWVGTSATLKAKSAPGEGDQLQGGALESEIRTGRYARSVSSALCFLASRSACLAQLLERSSVDARSLALRLGAESLAEGFRFYDVGALNMIKNCKSKMFYLHTFLIFGLAASSSNAIGSLLRRRRTEYGSCFLVERLVRK
jgi:hypothetical protein